MASLYICDLHPDVTEITLFKKFCDVGQIHSIRVCRDDVTRQSLGYAYVKFCKAADAETALYTMNHEPIKGQPARIVWSHHDPALRESDVGNIFIGNLDESVDSKALYDKFSAFGNILLCKVPTHDGVSKGHGFIHFETEEAASRAIKKVNGTLLHDKKVFVIKSQSEAIEEITESVLHGKNASLSQQPLTASMLAAAQPQEQKRILGEHLYPLIESSHPDLASKITGMLLEIDNSELLHMLKSRESLKVMVNEAAAVLQTYEEAEEDEKSYPMASLYVTDLHPDVTEAMLYEKFSQAGPVLSITVCRDVITRRSLGYAYVNFQQPADAERALDTLNYDPIKGRQIFIMWKKNDPSYQKSGVGIVFIKNLDKSIDNKALYDTFLAFGNILFCKVSCQGGVSNGYGFVHFDNEEAALRAIDKANGMLLNGKKIFVGKFLTRFERIMGESGHQFTNCFIKNFGDKLDENDLRNMFEKYGTIRSVVVMKDSHGKSRGFGFVDFSKHKEAQSAVDALNGTEIKNSNEVLYVGRAQRKQERQNELRCQFGQKTQDLNHQDVNLYVKNLDDNITEDDLREAFNQYGTITSAKIMYDAEVSRGFGFVCFSSPEEATKAVTEMNGRIVGSRPLYVALAQRKEDRKAHLTAQYMKKMGVTWPNQLMSQSFQAAGAPGYFMSFQGAQRTYMPSHLIRAAPRWQSPTQASFQMAGDMTTVGPRAMTKPIGAGGAMHPTQHVMQPQVMQPFTYTQSVRNPNIAGNPQPAQTQNQQQPDSAQPQEQK